MKPRLRIALLDANPQWGGGERWFLDAARALLERGHELRLVAAEEAPLFERFRELGAPVIPDHRIADAFADPVPAVALANSGREVRAALRGVAELRSAARARTRLVLRRGIDRPLANHWFRRRSWRRLSAILVNSDATGRTVRDSLPWFPEERIRRIHNPVTFEPAPRSPAPPGGEDPPFRIGVVARLVRQKGLDVLFEALAKLTPEDEPWTLDIAGDGKLRGELEELARRLEIADRVRFAGHVDALAPFYGSLDALVVPSRYEGFGFVAAEGLKAGLPVIASRTSSLPEIVDPGETGILVPPDDPEALATAIRALAADPVKAAAMGTLGQERASARFAPAPLHDALEDALAWAAGLPPVGRTRK